MTETHTPLPWKAQVLETEYDPGVYIVGSNLGGLVCAALPWPTEIDSGDYSRVEANAAFIVQAVNSHHDLIEALREARSVLAQITSGEAFREMRFAEDDDAEYHLRRERKATIFARDAAAKIDAILTKAEAGRG